MGNAVRATLFFTILNCFSVNAQSVYEIYCNAFAKGKELKNVHFELLQGDNMAADQVGKTGQFQFIIMKNDPEYSLKMSREGFITKHIYFRSETYPFANEYEVQDIDLEFKPNTSGEERIEKGQLRWSSLTNSFTMEKYDSTARDKQTEVKGVGADSRIDQIYILSMDNGDEMVNARELNHAKSYYRMALIAKPNDASAKEKLAALDAQSQENQGNKKVFTSEVMEQINRGELESVPLDEIQENVIFTVQLGAFSKKVNKADFNKVPDFKVITYEDFTRCFSGEFSDVNLAFQRKKEMIAAGFKDAWIVLMKGNERLGF